VVIVGVTQSEVSITYLVTDDTKIRRLNTVVIVGVTQSEVNITYLVTDDTKIRRLK
jgi:hypothetical protein